MSEAKNIYCPRCNRKVMTYDGRGTIYRTTLCRNCDSMVAYDPTTDKVSIAKKPQRITSGGKRIY